MTDSTARARAADVRRLVAQGVAVWLDDLSRARLASGNLADLVADAASSA